MLFKSASALAIFAVASQAIAEPMPYKPVKLSMSVREMFGVVRRDDSGYQPTQQYCGMGATCAEACGTGFDQCASNDKAIHCYNTAAAQTCCPDGSGNSCDAGFYCTADTDGETFCCPEGMSLTDCASKYGVTGALSSEIPTPTSTSTSSTSTSSSTSSTSTSTFYEAKNTTTVQSTGYVTTCTSTLSAEVTYPAANSTTQVIPATLTPTPSTVPLSGASAAGPAGALALFVAAALAAFL